MEREHEYNNMLSEARTMRAGDTPSVIAMKLQHGSGALPLKRIAP
jgi:hypothetical protein